VNNQESCLKNGITVTFLEYRRIRCALFVTSQFDVIFMFPNQRFGEDC